MAEIEYPLADRDADGWHADGDYLLRGGAMEWMSPTAFLASVRTLVIDETARDNIDDLKRHVMSGRRLDPLRLGKAGHEDGRHRAHAAHELGMAMVPVIVLP